MIGELKDIWIVFRKTYNEHFALKHKALDAIKEYETKMVAFKLTTIRKLNFNKTFDEKHLKFIHYYRTYQYF